MLFGFANCSLDVSCRYKLTVGSLSYNRPSNTVDWNLIQLPYYTPLCKLQRIPSSISRQPRQWLQHAIRRLFYGDS